MVYVYINCGLLLIRSGETEITLLKVRLFWSFLLFASYIYAAFTKRRKILYYNTLLIFRYIKFNKELMYLIF
jgi:hypothetical protein